jgi:hypothetical protein
MPCLEGILPHAVCRLHLKFALVHAQQVYLLRVQKKRDFVSLVIVVSLLT